MRIWLLKAGEPLPDSGTGDRLFRTGLLAGLLASRGHDVIWWTSTVDHVRKIQLAGSSTRRPITDRYSLWLLRGPMYRRNTSPMRFVNHRAIANEFQRLSAAEARPDVIVCSLPTVEFAGAASRYGRLHGVPVVIDIRDLWPDIVVHLAPRPLRVPARWALWWMYAEFRDAVRHADGSVRGQRCRRRLGD